MTMLLLHVKCKGTYTKDGTIGWRKWFWQNFSGIFILGIWGGDRFSYSKSGLLMISCVNAIANRSFLIGKEWPKSRTRWKKDGKSVCKLSL